jgi:L-fuculose-phosphate aldolase
MGDEIYITRRGSMLGDLREGDVIETSLDHDDSKVIMASTEIIVHRAIYQATSTLAIVHCHPPYAIALSLVSDTIVPVDSEGSYLLHRVPVLSTEKTIGSSEVAKFLPPLLKEYKIAMVRGHGSFAVGQLLEEGLMLSSALEVSSKIVTICRALDLDIKEYREKSDDYGAW